MMLYRSYQSYCHRLQHDMYFLTSTSRLNEQVVDKIVLQLNRVYPQILTNEEAEKFRNPKASLHTRLSDLLKHLQKKGDRHCQEFYRALQINAEQLFNDLPSRKILKAICIYPAQTGGRPFSAQGGCRVIPHPYLNPSELGKSGPILPQNFRGAPVPADWTSQQLEETPDPTEIDTDKEQYMLNDRGPVFFLACFSVAAGLALFWYCCNSETQVVGRARRILGFSPIIIGRHVRNICLLYLEDISRN
ncbi:caspase recruitment domain-containing protein 19 isoform 2-T2 [Sylvia borin]